MPPVPERLQAALRDRYAIDREIGRGGMATVYLARDVKHDRQVALKVLHPELAAAGYHPERFLREIRIVASFTHPNILPLHDSDECEGFLYFIMPYVTGGTLRDRLRRDGPLSIDEIAAITRGVASALDYAHRLDVLHRDIKPENILFNEGQAMVTDFGVARAISACCDDLGTLTEVGFAIGTPAYMSPEQAAADQELDGRSDVYSLACVVFEMLTGQPPFGETTPVGMLAKHAVAPPPPARTLRPSCPLAVEQALAKALAKAPDQRFATAGEFAAALTASTTGTIPVAPPADARRSIAVLPFVNASPDPENEYLSDGITDELIGALTHVEGLHVASRTSVFALKGERKDARSIGALLGVSALFEGSVRKAGQQLRITVSLINVSDGSTLWSKRFDRKLEDVFALQDEIAGAIVRALRATLLGDIGDPMPRRYTENVAAYNHYLKGRYFWNLRTAEGTAAAIEHFEQAIAEDPDYALAYTGLADCYAIHTDYRGVPVEEGMRRAKREARRALELDETLAEAHTSLAWVSFIYDWDWQGAGREFRRAIELNPRYATARQWHSWLLMAMGHIEESLAEGRVALELDPVSISVRRSLGWQYFYARRPARAIEHLKRAVELAPTAPENHRVLAFAYAAHGRLDEALTAAREAVATSDGSPYAVATLGHVHALRGETDEARRLLDDLARRAQTDYVLPVALVILHLALGEKDAALDWLERAREERRGWLCYIKVEPLLDPVRDEQRFKRLLEEMNLT
ncbi:MAG: protein kinase [Gemmatimonadota bacterium]|nr:MAG: protein kinase [Gemmatimonadota bacterium]